MAQRYRPGIAHERMADNRCPECGAFAEDHLDDSRFWMPRNCDLLPRGVTDRIEQYLADQKEEWEKAAADFDEQAQRALRAQQIIDQHDNEWRDS
jgi:hypothetical protein